MKITNIVVQAFMSSEKPRRIATLTRDIKGKFSRWKQGEQVQAIHVRGSSYLIEKLNPKKSGPLKIALPLYNQCAGIPRTALEFNEPKDK